MPLKFQFVVNRILSPSLAVLCSAVLAWKGWDAAIFSLRIGERSVSAWGEPLFPVKIMIPVGYGILFIVAVAQLSQGLFPSPGKYPGSSKTEELPDALKIISHTFPIKGEVKTLVDLEMAFRQEIARERIKRFYRATVSLGTILGFLFIKEEEMNNLRRTVRGIDYKLTPEEIKATLVAY